MAASTNSEMATSLLMILDLFCVVPCVVIKVPQLLTLYTSKTARGISLASTLFELISYTILTVYMFVTSKPIMNYVEYIFIIVQVWIVILMMLHYTDQMDFRLIPYSALYFATTAILGSGVAPHWFAALLLTLSTPLSASAIIFQIVAIYNIKDSGSVSFLSWFIAWATGFLRIISSLVIGDMLVVANYAITNVLRVVGCATILYYRPQAKKFH